MCNKLITKMRYYVIILLHNEEIVKTIGKSSIELHFLVPISVLKSIFDSFE